MISQIASTKPSAVLCTITSSVRNGNSSHIHERRLTIPHPGDWPTLVAPYLKDRAAHLPGGRRCRQSCDEGVGPRRECEIDARVCGERHHRRALLNVAVFRCYDEHRIVVFRGVGDLIAAGCIGVDATPPWSRPCA